MGHVLAGVHWCPVTIYFEDYNTVQSEDYITTLEWSLLTFILLFNWTTAAESLACDMAMVLCICNMAECTSIRTQYCH